MIHSKLIGVEGLSVHDGHRWRLSLQHEGPFRELWHTFATNNGLLPFLPHLILQSSALLSNGIAQGTEGPPCTRAGRGSLPKWQRTRLPGIKPHRNCISDTSNSCSVQTHALNASKSELEDVHDTDARSPAAELYLCVVTSHRIHRGRM